MGRKIGEPVTDIRFEAEPRRWISEEYAEELTAGDIVRETILERTLLICRGRIHRSMEIKSLSENRQDLTTPPADTEVTSSSTKDTAKLQRISQNLERLKENLVCKIIIMDRLRDIRYAFPRG